jgi:hypothetical protein
LANGLTFCAAIAGILIVHVVREARYDSVEPFPSRGEIDNGGEYRGIVVEKSCTRFSAASTAFWRNLICPFDLVV